MANKLYDGLRQSEAIWLCCSLKHGDANVVSSGVAGPLAAQGGCQICRPAVLGFWNWRACLKHKSHVMSTVTLVS